MQIFIGGKENEGLSDAVTTWIDRQEYVAINRQLIPQISEIDEYQQQQWWLLRKSHAAVFDSHAGSFRDGELANLAWTMKLPTLFLDGNQAFRGEDCISGWRRDSKNVQSILDDWNTYLDQEKDLYPHWQLYRNPKRGRYIAFEGLNSAGKGTQMELLEKRMNSERIDYWRGREPGTGPLGTAVRYLVQEQKIENPTITSEVALFMAQRGQLVENYIWPRMHAGTHVLLDRSDGTSLSFQGTGRGEGLERIALVNGYAVRNIHPDVVIYLQTHEEHIQNRVRDGIALDRFEGEGLAFDALCREGYDRVFTLDHATPPMTWYACDATQAPEIIHEQIWQIVKPFCGETV